MQVIYKYPLPPFGGVVSVPEGKVLAVAFQHGHPFVWIEHYQDTIHKMVLDVLYTGSVFDSINHVHVGSCVSDTLVLHAYRKIR